MRALANLIVAALVGCVVLTWSTNWAAAQRRTPVFLTRFSTGSDGLAHAVTNEVKLLPSTGRAGLDESAVEGLPGARLVRWPTGHVWDWHNADRRQYVVTLSGRAEVELAAGQKILLNPGQIVLAEDIKGKGHITRSIGSDDLVLLIVPMAGQ